MGGSKQELSGPNFRDGVALAAIPEGAPTLGHVEGESVVVVRRGGEAFAVGASCTHYGGPLAEGVVDGDTLHCPWHHACFDLRTGRAVSAPALSDVPCWSVEQRGGKLYVLGKKEAKAPEHAGGARPESVVIVGGGAAGHVAAETLRREGYEGKITIVSADPSEPVDRPNLSKDYLAGTAEEAWIPLRPREFFDEQRIDRELGAKVTLLDPQCKTITTDRGKVLPYGALLLATGAEPIRLNAPGADLPHVHTLRSLADSRALVEAAQRARRAVVVGAGFIGLEVAASLRARGVEVHVVAPDPRPLERIVGRELGDFVRSLHERHGVIFHLERTVRSIDAAAVTLSDGTALPADLVVVGVGVKPRTELAEEAGLAVDRGVVVDEYLETSAPGVFAAGDIARWPDPYSGQRIRVEHWVVAERHGQIAAKNILGQRVRCAIAPFFWSQHYDVTLSYVGNAKRWDRTDVAGDVVKGDCTVVLREGGKALAVITVGRDRESLQAEIAFERGDEATLAALATA